MPEEPIKTGVIGLGRSGWSIHSLGIAAHPLFSLAAVSDPVEERRREAEGRFGCRSYAEATDLIADPEVELVVVASPSHAHAPHAIAALRAGKHALVEKPMAQSEGEAGEMIAAARQAGRLLTAYQIRRLDPDFQQVQAVLASGVLGPLHQMRLGMYGYARRRDWQTLQRYGGGQLNNNGAHLVDQALQLAGGEWSEPFADLRRVASAGDAEDHVKVAFRGKGRVLVEVELAMSAYPLPRWFILGKYGSLVGESGRLDWKYYDPAHLPDLEVEEGPAPGRAYGIGETIPWVEESWEAPPREGDTRDAFYDRLHASIREGAPLLVPPEQTRALTALFDAFHAQSRPE
jgi:predicted dehydrogenase